MWTNGVWRRMPALGAGQGFCQLEYKTRNARGQKTWRKVFAGQSLQLLPVGLGATVAAAGRILSRVKVLPFTPKAHPGAYRILQNRAAVGFGPIIEVSSWPGKNGRTKGAALILASNVQIMRSVRSTADRQFGFRIRELHTCPQEHREIPAQ